MRQVLRPNLFMNHMTWSFLYEHEKTINKLVWQYISKCSPTKGHGLALGLNEKFYPFLEIPQKYQSFSNQIIWNKKYYELNFLNNTMAKGAGELSENLAILSAKLL